MITLKIIVEKEQNRYRCVSSNGDPVIRDEGILKRAVIKKQKNVLSGGGDRDRTDDLMLAKHALSQLSYTPKYWWAHLGSNQRPPRYQHGALTN